MQKIKFENKPSTKTPISAQNLNQMQDNIEADVNTRVQYEVIEDFTLEQ